jgi:hypothetical protein
MGVVTLPLPIRYSVHRRLRFVPSCGPAFARSARSRAEVAMCERLPALRDSLYAFLGDKQVRLDLACGQGHAVPIERPPGPPRCASALCKPGSC